MLTKRETSMSILLVSLLLMELSSCHVLGLGQLDENYMEMRLRRVLEKLVTLALPKGRMSRMAKDLEVEELLGKTKRALFGSPQWDTRRNDPNAGPNPGGMSGPDLGPFSISAGVMAGPKGIWAHVGGGPAGMGSAGPNGTWFSQMGHGMGGAMPNHVFWTITWPPNPANGPFWSTGTPKFQETTPFSWFTPHSSAWPNWGTTSPLSFNFGSPTNPPPWSTTKPFWLQDSTVSPSWFFSPSTNPPWFIAPKGANSDPLTKSPKARTDWDNFTKKIPPWRENSTTTLKPVANSTLPTKL